MKAYIYCSWYTFHLLDRKKKLLSIVAQEKVNATYSPNEQDSDCCKGSRFIFYLQLLSLSYRIVVSGLTLRAMERQELQSSASLSSSPIVSYPKIFWHYPYIFYNVVPLLFFLPPWLTGSSSQVHSIWASAPEILSVSSLSQLSAS